MTTAHPENPFDQGYWETDDLIRYGFKSVGNNVRVSKKCTILGHENISFGDNVRVDDFTLMTAIGGYIHVGSYVHIAAYVYLAGRGGIIIGDFAGLSHGTRVYSATDDYSGNFLTNPTIPKQYLNIQIGLVDIGRHALLGSGTIVLPDCTIGEGTATGALSLVTKTLAPWGIYVGQPAKLIKPRSKKLLEMEAALLQRL